MRAPIATPARRRGRSLLAASLVACALGAFCGSAIAAPAAPMWKVTMTHKNAFAPQERTFFGSVTAGEATIAKPVPGEEFVWLGENGKKTEFGPISPRSSLELREVSPSSLFPAPGAELSGAGIAPGTMFTRYQATAPELAEMSMPASSTHGVELITETIPGGVDPHTGSDETFARESGSNTYTITIRNGGEQASHGAVTVEDKLPPGLALSGTSSLNVSFPLGGAWKGQDCEVTTGEVQPGEYHGPSQLKCTTETSLAPGESYPPLTLYVHVTPAAPEAVTNEVTVSGGSAPASAKVLEEVKLTPAVPFGLALYNTSLSGEEAGLAGGHPVDTETNLLLNYTPEDHRGYVDPPGGGGKEFQAEVPPGFVGYVQSLPKCPLTMLRATHGSRCPANTIVGYTGVEFIGKEKIVGGKVGLPTAELPIFNMAPSAGLPAEFGLDPASVPILLEAKVRSNGDYGVNVGTTAAGKKVIADTATFCSNGVTVAKSFLSCRSAPAPSSKPFLANPTSCSEPAAWRLYADPWYEPTDYQYKENETPAPALSGCAALQFHPEIGFTPSRPSEGGTAQADEPTGITFNLTLPQAGEATPPASVGQALSCAPGQWTGLPWRQGPGGPGELVNESGEVLAVSYQWLANGVAISGATTHVYTPVQADEGKVLQCQVTAGNSGGAAASASAPVVVSAPPATVAPVAPAGGIVVSEKGNVEAVSTAKEETELSCAVTEKKWTPETTQLSYQWLRNGVAIPGKTQSTYKVASADVSSLLQCEVSGANAGGAVSAVSAGVEAFSKAHPASHTLPEPAGGNAFPEITGPPAPRATPQLKGLHMTLPEGMTVSPSAAHGLAACSRAQFDNAGEPPEVAPQATFRPEAPAQEATCPLASQIGTLEVFTPLLSGAPAAEGGLEAPNGVKCTEGQWGGSHTLSYQWLSNGAEIPGATEPTLKVTNASERNNNGEPEEEDENTSIQCEVTARNQGGSSVAVSRPAVQGKNVSNGEPLPPPLAPASIAAPSGDASAGGTLTCDGGDWTSGPTLSYAWLRAGTRIAGATQSTYTLGSADEGQVIQCQVAGKNAGGTTVADGAGVIVAPVPSTTPPLPGAAVQGQLFAGQPECSPCTEEDAREGKLFPLFIQLRDKEAGVIVKLEGKTRVTNPQTGQLESVFENQPRQPFELLKLELKGGPTAPLANSQSCGTATTSAEIEPWSAGKELGPERNELGTPIAGGPGSAPLQSSFTVQGCGASMPFAPSFIAGASSTSAGAATDFSASFGRNDGEQDLSGVTVRMPPGLVGKIPDVTLCGEAEALAQKEEAASEGHGRPHCPAASEIGTSVSLAGPGPDPFSTEGHAYLTGPIKEGPFPNAPFNLLVDTPAEAGPFNLGHVVVLSGITVDPNTAAVSVTSEPLPQVVSGVPIRLRRVEVNVTKQGFMSNPTNCNAQQVSATLSALQGASAQVASHFGVAGCQSLLFHPTFAATTQAHTSKLAGASLNVKITYPQGSNYANIAKSVTDLPIQLPSRLETLHKACVDTVFEANPAACPAGSAVGLAIAHTPLLNKPLQGPAYLVSHGNRAFPDLEIVLQGEGVTVVLDGHTDIKKGITKTTFESVPDSPVESFELNLPEGSNSILAAPENLCTPTRTATVKKSVEVRRNGRTVTEHKTVTEKVPEKLIMPTELVGQNGAVIKQSTVIAVSGCPRPSRS